MLMKADFDAFQKEYWTPLSNHKLWYENRPFLAMVPKDTDAGGEYIVTPVYLDEGADGSPTFSDAQATAAASGTDGQRKQFQSQFVEDFQITQISNKLIRLSRKTPQLALQRAVDERKNKKNVLSQRIARNLWRTGYGELGVVDSAVSALSTSIIGLSQKVDARNFRIGQRLVFASTTTAALRDSGDYVTVTAIDFDNKKITTDAPTSLTASIASIATGDVIFLKGARGVGATPTKLTLNGVPSWIPDTAPTAGDSFEGQDRSVWADRLAGLRYPASGTVSGPTHEIMIDALIDGAIREAHFTHCFMDPVKYGDLIKGLEGTVQRVTEKVGTIGFNGVEIQIGYGTGVVKIFPDANVKPNYAYNLTMDTWKLHSAGELIQNDLQHGAGRDIENSSGIEYRDVFTGQLTCNAPGKNQVVKFA